MRMKVAVSIPDPVFEAAERLATERGVARSQVYAEALKAYLEHHGPDAVTARLNEVHGERAAGLDEDLMTAQLQSIDHEAW